MKYIGGLNYYDYRLQTDVDGTNRAAPFRVTNAQTGTTIPGGSTLIFPRQNNQYEEEVWWFLDELNFTSTNDGPVQWLLGLYQFREGSNYTNFDARYPDDARFENPVGPTGAAGAPKPAAPLRLRQLGERQRILRHLRPGRLAGDRHAQAYRGPALHL